MKRDSKAAQREKRFDVKLERVRKFEKERERHLRNNGRTLSRVDALAQASGTMARYHRQVAGFQRHTLQSLPGLETFFWNSFSLQKSVSRGNHSLISCNRVENALARAKTRLTLVRQTRTGGGKRSKRRLVVTRQKLLGRRAFHSA